MGDVMQDISNWIPLTHVIRSIQEPWLGIGSPTNHFVIVSVILIAATGVSLTLAARADR